MDADVAKMTPAQRISKGLCPECGALLEVNAIGHRDSHWPKEPPEQHKEARARYRMLTEHATHVGKRRTPSQDVIDVHPEDALKFVVESLAKNPHIFARGQSPSSYDIWVPNAVDAFVRANVEPQTDSSALHDARFSALWRSFYDAAWELSRRGVFRFSMTPEGISALVAKVSSGPFGDGYPLTAFGLEWLKAVNTRYFPTEPGKYAEALAKPAKVLGPAFLQRASEAAKCHQFANYLACCAMCGAAAESLLLTVAIARSGDEELVLKEYRRAGGRQKLMAKIFETMPSVLRHRFELGFGLLASWRDDAAHGRLSEITEVEAYHAMGQLMHLAMLTFDRWTELTGKTLS